MHPYEYLSVFEKYKQEWSRKEKFHSSLNGRRFMEKEYKHVLNVLEKSEMKTMKDHHDLYLKCDILLSDDVFEKCRNNSLNNYGLYPSYYLSAPCKIWDAMLRMINIKLELIPDPDICIFFEKVTRGGISCKYS